MSAIRNKESDEGHLTLSGGFVCRGSLPAFGARFQHMWQIEGVTGGEHNNNLHTPPQPKSYNFNQPTHNNKFSNYKTILCSFLDETYDLGLCSSIPVLVERGVQGLMYGLSTVGLVEGQ